MVVGLIMLFQFGIRYETPEQYYGWWDEIGTCSEYEVTVEELDSIEFFFIRAETFMVNGEVGYIAYAFVHDDQIFIVDSKKDEEYIVKHEMLHFILWWFYDGYSDTGGHPPEFSRCFEGTNSWTFW